LIYAKSVFPKQPNIGTVFLPTVKTQLPAWYHIASENRPINNNAARCLIHKHGTKTITDLLRVSNRLRAQGQNNPHRPSNFCRCRDRINTTFPKLNPLAHDNRHGNFSLTPARKRQNSIARENNNDILFNPSITCKNSLTECFRVFTDPERTSKNPAKRMITKGANQRHEKIEIYTNGAATIVAIQTVPHFVPIRIVTDSTYVINGLTKHLLTWENHGKKTNRNIPLQMGERT